MEHLAPEDKTKEYLAAAQRIQGLMRTIGNTEKTKVHVGKRGGGSFFNWQEPAITIDPIDFDRGETEALGIGAHEAMHCRIDRPDEVPDIVWENQGFNFLFQTIADARVYQATANMYSGAAEWMRTAAQSLEGKNERLNLEFLQQEVGGELGYIPLSTRFCVEIQKRRVLGKATDDSLPPRVQAAIEKTQDPIDKILQMIPDFDASEEDIRKNCRDTFAIINEEIWPTFEELINRDEENENIRQYLLHLFTEQNLTIPEILDLLDLDDEGQAELTPILRELDRHIRVQRQKGEEKKFSFVDFDGISQKVRGKIMESRDTLVNKKKREQMEQKAQQTLDKIEDKAVQNLRPQLVDPEKFETHAEKKEREAEGRMKRSEQSGKKTEEHTQSFLIRRDNEAMTYEQGYNEVVPQITELHERLSRIIKPTRSPTWKRGFPTGARVTLKRAMDFDADRSQYNKLMERLGVPQLRDGRFTTLFDCSYSMNAEDRIAESFKMGIATGNVYDELLGDFEFLMFNTFPNDKDELERYILKRYGEPFQHTEKKRLEKLFTAASGRGSMKTDLAPAVKWASDRLDQHAGRDNYLFVVTDGEPSGGTEQDLHREVKRIMARQDQVLIGIGIGEGTETVKRYFPLHIQVPNVKLFIPAMGDLLEDITNYPEKYKRLL